jgi:CRISPR system Cascade subunit CasA
MNLAFDPWIPVIRADGTRVRVSLCESLTVGARYLDFDVLPHERIALMRLHICIAQAALDGPRSADDIERAGEGLPRAAVAYLEKWRDHFDLFHPETPFLQRVDISKPLKLGKRRSPDSVEATSVTKLVFSLATGNNSALFDHAAIGGADRAMPHEDLAIALVTFQNFSPGGLIAQLFWSGEETSKSSNHAPCTPGSMLHVFIRRQNVFATILANLLTKGQIERNFGKQGWGAPIWEMTPANSKDAAAVDNATISYLGRLVPMSRFIRFLSTTEMLLGNGFNYPSFQTVAAEPSATVALTHDGNERYILGAKLDHALWRQLYALGKLRRSDENTGITGGAVALQSLSDDAPCDIWVGALITNKATIIDTVESVFSLPAGFRLDENLGRYRKEVGFVDGISRRLKSAIETYRKNVDGAWESRLKQAGPKKNQLRNRLSATALRHFWTAIEANRDKLIRFAIADEDHDEEAKKEWATVVYSAARDAYRAAFTPQTARERRAYTLGLKTLLARTKSINDALETKSDSDDNEDEEQL